MPLIFLVSAVCAMVTPGDEGLPAGWSPFSHFLGKDEKGERIVTRIEEGVVCDYRRGAVPW